MEHLEKAQAWVDETGCMEIDLHSDGLEELIEHLKLKKFAATRLRKALDAAPEATVAVTEADVPKVAPNHLFEPEEKTVSEKDAGMVQQRATKVNTEDAAREAIQSR